MTYIGVFILSLSFAIWFLISSFLVGFWVWTSYILYKQKRAWKIFADTRKLRYYSNSFYDGPSMSGAIGEYKISIFTSEHSELDARSKRRLTAIEVNLSTGLTVTSAVASGGMVSVIEGVDMIQEYKPQVKGWDDAYIARTNDLEYMQAYLNDERLTKLIELMNVKKAWVVLVFFDATGLLRFDTPTAVDDPREMDGIIKQIISVARALEIKDGEEKDLQRKRVKKDLSKSKLQIDDDLLDDDIGLELENDN